jgi:GTPase SAR1 family protein
MIEVEIRAGIFYSSGDKDGFFHCLSKLIAVQDKSFLGNIITLKCKDNLDEIEFREMIGFFYRYKQDLKLLRAFETDEHKNWLHNKSAYWYRRMYSPDKISKSYTG